MTTMTGKRGESGKQKMIVKHRVGDQSKQVSKLVISRSKMNPSKKRDDGQMPMPRIHSNRQLEEPVYFANDANQLDRNIHDMETQIQQNK